MKKIMYFAAALLVLVGCQKSQEAKENAPVNYGTITGKIELPQGPNKISAIEGWQSASGNFQMQWEEGDEVLIGNQQGELKLLTLKSIDEEGVATFEGELLSDMSLFEVAYGVDPSNVTNAHVPYIKDNYRPFAMGYGTDGSFTIDMFLPVFGMRLKGTAALTKIEASFNVDNMDFNVTMTFDENPLQLSSTPQIVYFPITSSFTTDGIPLTFKFYDAGGLILTKTIEKACLLNQVITFTSDLEVNGTAPAPTYEYVDLGLSVNWATFNVGATKPEEYGDYFAWGETAPYYNTPITDPLTWKTGKESGYAWASYFDTNDGETFTKYNLTGGLTTLDPEDDAAHVKWGGSWRMPTKDEFDELANPQNCEWKWCDGETEKYNNTTVKGYLVKSLKEGYTDNSIFLPAAGFYNGSSLNYGDSYGLYWSSSLYGGESDNAYILVFISGYVDRSDNARFIGQSVRPVCK